MVKNFKFDQDTHYKPLSTQFLWQFTVALSVRDKAYELPPINFRAILLATLRHVVQNHRTVITQQPPSAWIFVLRLFPSKGKSQLKSFTFSSLLFYMGEKQTRFVKSSDKEIKKLVANAVPESTKKSTKYAVNVFEESLFRMTVCQGLVQSQ